MFYFKRKYIYQVDKWYKATIRKSIVDCGTRVIFLRTMRNFPLILTQSACSSYNHFKILEKILLLDILFYSSLIKNKSSINHVINNFVNFLCFRTGLSAISKDLQQRWSRRRRGTERMRREGTLRSERGVRGRRSRNISNLLSTWKVRFHKKKK